MKAVLNGQEAAATPASAVDFAGLSAQQLLAVHRCMLLSRKLDDKEIQLKNQSQIFSRSAAPATKPSSSPPASTLKPGYDWFFPTTAIARCACSSA